MNLLELKIPPPVVALVLAVLMWLTPSPAGLVQPEFVLRIAAALALVLVGQTLSVSAIAEFRRARTTVNPIKAHAATSLVSSGIFRYTRNPMYLGLLLTLLGWAAYLANPFALAFLPVFALYMTRFQIKPEERILSSLFGASYAAYRGRVRRWF
jgi:protein-S-isoprenylcysteine O-methyltransferase Ste14